MIVTRHHQSNSGSRAQRKRHLGQKHIEPALTSRDQFLGAACSVEVSVNAIEQHSCERLSSSGRMLVKKCTADSIHHDLLDTGFFANKSLQCL